MAFFRVNDDSCSVMDPVNDYKTRLHSYLLTAVQNDASDIHFVANRRPMLRIKDKLVPMGKDGVPGDTLKKILFAGMTEEQQTHFKKNWEIDFGLEIEGIGRFRANVFTALNEPEAVLRIIKPNVKNNADLGLPAIINELATRHDGIVLVAGSTGSGKSTTLAAMIDYINTNQNKRIITVEDPVEIIHIDKKSVISQREVGQDTISYPAALKSLMRQNPDVILIGEIRDKETAESALQAAQTGHLVLSTVHASSADQTVERFAGLYPMEERAAVKRVLSYTLQGVIAQRLIVSSTAQKIPLLEIMTGSKRVRDSILADANEEPGHETLHEVIATESMNHMQTLDQHIMQLIQDNVITPEKGLEEAANPHWIRQQMQQLGYYFE